MGVSSALCVGKNFGFPSGWFLLGVMVGLLEPAEFLFPDGMMSNSSPVAVYKRRVLTVRLPLPSTMRPASRSWAYD